MYKKFLFTAVICVFACAASKAQSLNADLIKLARIYRNFHSFNNSPGAVTEQLNSVTTTDLSTARDFVAEAIKSNNNLTDKKYLTKPDTATLKHLYTIRMLNWKMFEDKPVDYNAVIDSLNSHPTSNYEYVSCYYNMIFTSVGNKNRPFNLSHNDFNLDGYNLADDTEKGIFFLEAMNMCGTYIWGYMNIVNPPNYKEAYKYIEKYPKFNGMPYYQFHDLNFTDFNLTLDKTKPKESFKKYYINKYLNTLLYHGYCLAKKNKTEKRQQVMLGSILRNDAYYKYSDHPEVFEQLFKKVSQD